MMQSVEDAPKWLRVTLACGCCALGFAALGYALLLWIGTGLNKQTFDAETIVGLLALGIMGALLILVGAKMARQMRRSDL